MGLAPIVKMVKQDAQPLVKQANGLATIRPLTAYCCSHSLSCVHTLVSSTNRSRTCLFIVHMIANGSMPSFRSQAASAAEHPGSKLRLHPKAQQPVGYMLNKCAHLRTGAVLWRRPT